MTSYFESESMVYAEAIMAREVAWHIMDLLGRMGCLHIVPPSSALLFENPFAPNLRRCQETLVRVSRIKDFLREFAKKQLIYPPNDKPDLLFREFDEAVEASHNLGPLFFNTVDEEISKMEEFLMRQKKQYDNIQEAKKRTVLSAALLITLSKSIRMESFQGNNLPLDLASREQEADDHRRKSFTKLEYKYGLINREDQMLLKRIVFRISHGNAWVETYEIDCSEEALRQIAPDAKQQQFLQGKLAFIIVYQSGEYNIIQQKVTRVVNSLDSYVEEARLDARMPSVLEGLKQKKRELDSLQQMTEQAIENYVNHLFEQRKLCHCSHLIFLEKYVLKERALYQNLTQCTSSSNFLIFNTFIPRSQLAEVNQIRVRKSDVPSLILNLKQPPTSPPTLFPTTQIIEIPQEIVNTYGIPSYKEFNPATLYIVTFGFFVGVMFGDLGHMLLGVAAMLYLKPNRWWWSLIFWMGYCGLIYNQFFGLNLGLFQSCYRVSHNQITKKSADCVYIFGVDPVWKIAGNRMAYTNSFKMKLAVILGVVHMMFGILIRAINAIKKGSCLEMFTVVLPQFLFMCVTFVYMDFLIIYKWLKPFPDSSKAPSIINTMISMVVGTKEAHPLVLFEEEKAIEKILMATALVLIPVLLLAKPLVMSILKKNTQPYNNHSPRGSDGEGLIQEKNQELAKELQNRSKASLPEEAPLVPESDSHSESFGEVMVHQLIETIEFVLGSVSNTASYLRLWALSLAHTQLSEVFFDLLLKEDLIQGYSAAIKLCVKFFFFITVSFGVLFCMDVMECFLHSLRLHWVEFQNKFFVGAGYVFKPYCFSTAVKLSRPTS